MALEASRYVIALSTGVSRGCEFCNEWFDGERIQEATNHYLQQHGCIVLHVGAQSALDPDGTRHHATAIVLGSQCAPSPPRSTRFVVTPGDLDE